MQTTKKLAAMVAAFALLLVSCLFSISSQPAQAGSYGFPKKAEDSAAANADDVCVQGGKYTAGNDTAQVGTDGDYIVPTCNDVGNLKVQNEPTRKATYAVCTGLFTAAASATDVWQLYAGSNKVVKVLKVYYVNTSAGSATVSWDNISLIKRSTANSGGTAVTNTQLPLDANFAASDAVSKHYTANPTLGTTVATIAQHPVSGTVESGGYPASNVQGIIPEKCIFDADKFGSPIVLRGTGQGIVLNLNGVTQTGTSPKFAVRCVWTEEHPALVALALIGLFGAHSRRRREIDKLRRVA